MFLLNKSCFISIFGPKILLRGASRRKKYLSFFSKSSRRWGGGDPRPPPPPRFGGEVRTPSPLLASRKTLVTGHPPSLPAAPRCRFVPHRSRYAVAPPFLSLPLLPPLSLSSLSALLLSHIQSTAPLGPTLAEKVGSDPLASWQSARSSPIDHTLTCARLKRGGWSIPIFGFRRLDPRGEIHGETSGGGGGSPNSPKKVFALGFPSSWVLLRSCARNPFAALPPRRWVADGRRRHHSFLSGAQGDD